MSFEIKEIDLYSDQKLLTAIINNIPELSLKRLEITGKLYLDDQQKNDYVVSVYIRHCSLTKIPQNLFDFFPNYTKLTINNCCLKSIHRNDLKVFKALKYIHFWNMSIETIPFDLFADFEDIRGISFFNAQIKFIGKDAFKHLKKLEYVDLRGNPTIDLCYAQEKNTKFLNEFLEGKNITKIKNLNELHAILVGIFHDDGFKDLTIKIGENEFKVHKLMLAARSSTLAEMIKNRDELILDDIEVDIFKIILGYIYNDKLPQKYDENSLKVFEAAKKFKLDALELKILGFIWESLNFENALFLLEIGCKSNDEDLKNKSFKEIQKLFTNKILNENLMDDPEKLREMFSKKRSYEEEIRDAENAMKRARDNYEMFMKEDE